MADSTAYAASCQSLKTELESVVARFDTLDVVDIWRSAAILHEEIFALTDLTVIRLRQFHNITVVPEVYKIYTDVLTTLLLKINLKAFSSLAVGIPTYTSPS